MKLFWFKAFDGGIGTIAQVRQALPIWFALLDERHLIHRSVKCILCVFVALAFGIASAETEIMEAKVLEITERGFVLQVGTEPLAVDDEHDTRFWKGKSAVKREAISIGDSVFARIKVDNDPPVLREIADKETWRWLDKIRTEPQQGIVEKIDSKTLTAKFPDGTSFVYRATDKTKVQVKAVSDPGLTDLKAGQTVYLRGRTLSNLDTWLALVSDTPLPMPKGASSRKSSSEDGEKAKVPRGPTIPTSGSLTGYTLALLGKLSMFDVIADPSKALHISYNDATQFFYEGKRCRPDVIIRGLRFKLLYRRDRFGRILATKVELYMRR